MVRLIDIILEGRYTPKQSLKKAYHTYSCYFVVKFLKSINRTQALERIRGIKSITVVDVKTEPGIEAINQKSDKYNYEPILIKFVTNKDPEKHLEDLVYAMVKSDKEKGIDNILGVVAAKPRVDTLTKLK
jgi:hypothetical protein